MDPPAFAQLAGSPLAAQTFEGDGWWSPLVFQPQDGDRSGSVLADVVLGRAPQAGSARGRQNAPGRQNGRAGNVGANRGNGPPFCRSGAGHPVHGVRWCDDKGWSEGWSRATWQDVIFRGPTPTQGRRVTQPTLGDILGSVVLERLTGLGRDAGLTGGVDGRWLPLASGGTVLQLRMNGVPLAELADLNSNGRADIVLLSR